VDDLMQARGLRSGVVPASGRSWRAYTFTIVLAAYLLLIISVLHPSITLTIDRTVRHLYLYSNWPQGYLGLHPYVMFGQRGPSTLVALPWFLWMAYRFRSPRPLLMLGTALLVLNLSVGVVKISVGRLGPQATRSVYAVFKGGDIFPSGHTANAVVLYGVIAMLAVQYGLRFRRTVIAAAVFLSVTVGLSTLYLATHWLSDVVGGWLAGALVLLVLPTLMPYAERLYAAGRDRLDAPLSRLARRGGERRVPVPVLPEPATSASAADGSLSRR
jgi:membrane-associated phospholipid phosphatase